MNYLKLSASQFKVIAEWEHKGILSLLETNATHRSIDGMFDSSIRRAHKESFELAENSLHADLVDTREITSITMAINPKKFNNSPALIRLFPHRVFQFTSRNYRQAFGRASLGG